MPREEIDAFFEMIPASFTDPLTGVRPSSERELSAVLAVKHNFKEVQWCAVPVGIGFPLKPQGDASSFINPDDQVFCEYPLFTGSQHDIDRWGAMTSDLVFLSSDRQRVIFVECKVDSHFTHGDNPPDGQLSRYLEFLDHLSVKRWGLLLICPAGNRDWYAKRLALSAEKASSEVSAVLTTWEQIFDATQTSSIDPSSVISDGRYTMPRTWGVYQVERLLEGKRFRFGNHPIRQQELIREYGGTQLVRLYKTQICAKEAAHLLNAVVAMCGTCQ